MAGALSQGELRDWLRLLRTERVGPVTFFGLLARFGSAAAALDALPGLSTKVGRKVPTIPSVSEIEDEIAATERVGGRFIATTDPLSSPLLAEITPPPPLITVRGDVGLLRKTTVGIVGSRNASVAGLKMARLLARGLGEAGVVVASGFARGIDGAAHEESLATGTIGVLAGGIDHIYPVEHAALHAAVAERGLLVSESRYGHEVQARDFPRRNRIISGLSCALVVVEAEDKSGSLLTARMAGEQGREVLAVPGSPLDPRAHGTNGLIRDGAQLVSGVADVLDAIRRPDLLRETDRNQRWQGSDDMLDPPKSVIDSVAALLSPTPMTLNDIARETGLPWRTVAAVLVELELTGRAHLKNGGTMASC